MRMLLQIAILWGAMVLTGCVATAPGPNTHHRLQQDLNNIAAHKKGQKVALLLPLSGPYAKQAKRIERGFFAQYYQAQKSGTSLPHIMVVNTAHQPILTTYKNAIKQGAQIIIGPLLKKNVATLQHQSNITVPTIALNALSEQDYSQNPHHRLLEFGLSPQYEARWMAQTMARAGLHKALVIALKGPWGSGILHSFDQAWREQGGIVVGSLAVDEQSNYANGLRQLLAFHDVDESDDGLNNNDESFTQDPNAPLDISKYRRDDFDVVFLITPPAIARQIKPLLKFFYAGDVPVYATSLVYAGQRNPQADRDLNGIIFCDMPSVLAQSPHQLAKHPLHQRLYAFGEDAFLIATHLADLASGASISGKTGQLLLAANRHVVRQLSLAQFHHGLAIPIKKAST